MLEGRLPQPDPGEGAAFTLIKKGPGAHKGVGELWGMCGCPPVPPGRK